MILLLLSLSSFAKIQDHLTAREWDQLKTSREIVSRVDFKKNEQLNFYAAFQTSVSTDQAEQVMTQYGSYEKFIPFVSRSRYDAQTQLLEIEGGVMGWNLSSTLKMSPLKDGHLGFEIIKGHFRGLKGQMLTERSQDYKTWVLIKGELIDKTTRWPPEWIIENGGKIVFQVSGSKLRGLMEDAVKPKESTKETVTEKVEDQNDVPQPRRAKSR